MGPTRLKLTPDHLVFVVVMLSEGSQVVARPARAVHPGDQLLALSVEGILEPTVVEKVVDMSSKLDIDVPDSSGSVGAFAPLTETGTIVVDGVSCSNYADVVDWGPGFHVVAHRALGPWRSLLSTALGCTGVEPARLLTSVKVAVHGAAPDQTSSWGDRSLLKRGDTRCRQGLHPVASLLLATYHVFPSSGWQWLDA